MTTRGIVFFDIDGTLVPAMSSSSFLASRLGHQRELDRAEQRYAVGELTNEEVSVIDAAGWRGMNTRTVDGWLDDLPLIDGIEEVMSWCHDHRIEPALASLAWQPVSSSLARRYGFTTTGGPQVGSVETVYDGTVAHTSTNTTNAIVRSLSRPSDASHRSSAVRSVTAGRMFRCSRLFPRRSP